MPDHRKKEVVAIVPVKELARAKSRLSKRLSPEQRAALSLNMLSGVVRAVMASPSAVVRVVGGGAVVKKAALDLGAEWNDDRGLDLNDALWHAFQVAHSSGLAPMYLAADLPFLEAAEVAEALREFADGACLVLSPARRDGGTNAIVAPSGSPFRPALGNDSFQAHSAQASALTLPSRVCSSPGLGLDLDTVEDLDAFEVMEPGLLERLTRGGAS